MDSYKIIITRHVLAENRGEALKRVIKYLQGIVENNPLDFEGRIEFEAEVRGMRTRDDTSQNTSQ